MDNKIKEIESKLMPIFESIDERCYRNSEKVLNAFREERVSQSDFNSTTGYGYDDVGRDKIERVFARVLGSEDALVRNQFISGTHALTVTLFGLLRPGDTLLSICGKPYDTLDEVIGIIENPSSLISWGIHYDQIDLVDDDFDIPSIQEYLKSHKVKVIEIQRSKGYSTRKSLTIDKVERVVKAIREVDREVIIMVDNCYCEFVSDKEPTEVGVDIMVGSLIKNLGGGLAPNGAYVAGRADLIELVAERLTAPGEGKDVGPSLGINRTLLQGLFFAPSVVASSLKTGVLTSALMADLGYDVEPKASDERADIVQNIIFHNREDMIRYCEIIQKYSPIDSDVSPVPCSTPGYLDPIIMAAGTFTQGSSIELSCDGPLREPFIAYQQGGLTYEYGKLAISKIYEELGKKSS